MRTIAAIPASALLAGAASGLLLSNPPYVLASAFVAASVAAALVAYALRRPLILAVAVISGFLSGGALLSSVAWQRAWRPSLHLAFERLARAERAQAEREGRRLPDDDEAFAIVEGVLRADASASDGGVSLSVAVEGLEGQDGREGTATPVARAFQASDDSSQKQIHTHEREDPEQHQQRVILHEPRLDPAERETRFLDDPSDQIHQPVDDVVIGAAR
jgi:hypothetical protein